jgi:CBS domain-containing protein
MTATNGEKLNNNMSKKLITVMWNDDLLTAMLKMKNARIRHLPVVDQLGEVLGILSHRDIPTDGSDEDYAMEIVRDYMSTPVHTVEFKTNLVDVAKQMIDKKISSLLVQDNNEVVGIVTHEDLLKALVHILEKPPVTDRLLGKLIEFNYNSPVGQVVNTLAEMGI